MNFSLTGDVLNCHFSQIKICNHFHIAKIPIPIPDKVTFIFGKLPVVHRSTVHKISTKKREEISGLRKKDLVLKGKY